LENLSVVALGEEIETELTRPTQSIKVDRRVKRVGTCGPAGMRRGSDGGSVPRISGSYIEVDSAGRILEILFLHFGKIITIDIGFM
jgi:hypothetical protein